MGLSSKHTKCEHTSVNIQVYTPSGLRCLTAITATRLPRSWMLYLGQKDVVIFCAMALFLVMAVGIDCTFIFVSAMKGAGPDTSIEEATG